MWYCRCCSSTGSKLFLSVRSQNTRSTTGQKNSEQLVEMLDCLADRGRRLALTHRKSGVNFYEWKYGRVEWGCMPHEGAVVFPITPHLLMVQLMYASLLCRGIRFLSVISLAPFELSRENVAFGEREIFILFLSVSCIVHPICTGP